MMMDLHSMRQSKVDYKEVFRSWKSPLNELLSTTYTDRLFMSLQHKYSVDVIRPPKRDIFRPFKVTPFDKVRVVVIGQDPYPNARASGLAFGNEDEFAQFTLSPSLVKIAECIEKTIYDGLNYNIKFDPSLLRWGEEGVLLLNSALTVKQGEPGSHTIMWSRFIREVVTIINREKSGIFFLFLGAQARYFERFVNIKRNYSFHYHHPAFAARINRDWNCPHFKEINNLIEKQNGKEYCIKW